MFKRKSRAERVADEAWDNLVSAIESAGDVARSVGRRTVDLASDVAGEAQSRLRDGAGSVRGSAGSVRDSAKERAAGFKDEAWTRASNALDALAGRKPRKPWGWIGVALLGGVAVGWAVAATAPKAISTARQLAVGEDDLAPEVEQVPAPVPPGAGDAV